MQTLTPTCAHPGPHGGSAPCVARSACVSACVRVACRACRAQEASELGQLCFGRAVALRDPSTAPQCARAAQLIATQVLCAETGSWGAQARTYLDCGQHGQWGAFWLSRLRNTRLRSAGCSCLAAECSVLCAFMCKNVFLAVGWGGEAPHCEDASPHWLASIPWTLHERASPKPPDSLEQCSTSIEAPWAR